MPCHWIPIYIGMVNRVKGSEKNSVIPYNKNLKELSKSLRSNLTEAEWCLWKRIRLKHLGYVFYRQKPIGDYIVDFYCPRAKLVIEVDGSTHFTDETIEYDRIREECMSSLGLRVIRFTNTEVLMRIEWVIKRIEEEISVKIPFSPPLLKGGDIKASPFGKGRTRGI